MQGNLNSVSIFFFDFYFLGRIHFYTMLCHFVAFLIDKLNLKAFQINYLEIITAEA